MEIGFDVDVCLIRSDLKQIEYLCNLVGMNLDDFYRYNSPPYEYGVARYFEKELEHFGEDGLEYWRGESIYDDINPEPVVIDIIDSLYLKGHDIRFVTKIKGNHHKSKCEMLKRNFPFFDAIICTHEKGALSGSLDVMIDDRIENLEQFNQSRTEMLIASPSPYKQMPEEDRINSIIDFSDFSFDEGWEEIRKILGG